jgi:ParB-like chromosome segregation protein Spo0J
MGIRHRIGMYEILDGFHRFHAHRLEGRKTIQITVVVDLLRELNAPGGLP